MIKKIIKYSLLMLLVLLFLIITSFVYLFHSNSGSKMAIRYALEFTGLNVSYDHIDGTLASGLKISHLKYIGPTSEIDVKSLSYQLNIQWLSAHLNVSDLVLENVILRQTGASDQPFKPLVWPVSVDINKLKINQLQVISNNSINKFNQVEMIASLNNHQSLIKTLNFNFQEAQVQISGQIDMLEGVNYMLDIKADLEQTEGSLLTTTQVQGDSDQFSLLQTLDINTQQINAQFQVKGTVGSLTENPTFDLSLSSDKVLMWIGQNKLNLNQLNATLNGPLNDYQLSLDTRLQTSERPKSQIKIIADGNLSQLITKQAMIMTDDGQLNIQSNINWQDQINVNGQVELMSFNPGQLLSQWQGQLNGQVDFLMNFDDEGKISVSSEIKEVKGFLNNKAVDFSGKVDYEPEKLIVKQLNLMVGDSNVYTHGQISAQQIELDMQVDWQDFSMIDPQLEGHVIGSLSVFGNHQNPGFKTALTGQNIRFDNHIIGKIGIDSEGVWQQNMNSNIVVENVLILNQTFNKLRIEQSGWLDEHNFNIVILGDELSQNLNLSGKYASVTKQWSAVILNHNIKLKNGQQISLQDPVELSFKDNLSIKPACWKGVEQGVICLEINNTLSEISGMIRLQSLSLLPFQTWLPENLKLTGYASGNSQFNYRPGYFDIGANFYLENGELSVYDGQINSYQSAIDIFELTANSDNDQSNIGIKFNLEDDSFFTVQSQIRHSNKDNWQINADINGELNNTHYLSQISEEISEINGEFIFNGQATGQLSNPDISFNLIQPDGYVRLARSGTAVEKLQFEVETKGFKEPFDYQINLSAYNIAALNQGYIKSNGTLSKQNDHWQYDGFVEGQNFMVFNVPEMMLKVSPEISVGVNDELIKISGDLVIDQGKVSVKQLPPETVSNSEDLVVHSAENSSKMVTPVVLNVDTKIKDKIELDLLGLKANLLGGIKLSQQANQKVSASGSLYLSDGSYQVYGQNLAINEGELTFNGAIENPRLNVKASRKSLDGNVVAGVKLGGSVANLESELFSIPSQSDIETLSYIMTGNGIKNAGSISAEQLQQTAIIMGLNQSAPVFKQIQNTFGIDVLTIKESVYKKDTVIEAGKKINDELYISYNQGIFNRLGFWVLKYRINQFLNLQTTQSEEQSIELVYTRKSKPDKN